MTTDTSGKGLESLIVATRMLEGPTRVQRIPNAGCYLNTPRMAGTVASDGDFPEDQWDDGDLDPANTVTDDTEE